MEPTATQIRDAASIVRYEITAFIGLFTRILRGELPQDRITSNACGEAWLLHARILIDFFETSQATRCKDDLISLDYGFAASTVTVDTTNRERLNKDLAHLTFSRIEKTRNTRESQQAKMWNLTGFSPLVERCDGFVEHMRCKVLSRSGDAAELSAYAEVHSGVRALLTKLGC